MFILSIFLLSVGYLFHMVFPINKALWSSSFVIVTSGWATLILTIIYYFRDVKNYQFGTIFKYLGINAITIYFLSSFISKTMYLTKLGESNLHGYLYETIFVRSFFTDNFSSFLYALSVVIFYVGLALYMFRKNIFIKV